MKITTLQGNREDMMILTGLIEKYFKQRQVEEYAPEGMKCKVIYFLWPVKAFTIHLAMSGESICKTIPFEPVIQDFSEKAEDLIAQMIEDLEKQILEQKNIANN